MLCFLTVDALIILLIPSCGLLCIITCVYMPSPFSAWVCTALENLSLGELGGDERKRRMRGQEEMVHRVTSGECISHWTLPAVTYACLLEWVWG